MLLARVLPAAPTHTPAPLVLTTALALVLGCGGVRDDAVGDPGDPGPGDGGDAGDEDDWDDDAKLDVGAGGDGGEGCIEGGDCPKCSPPPHTACDGSDDPVRAFGLDCPGEHPVEAELEGSELAIGVRSGLGADDTFDPREGERYLVLGTGRVAELDEETPDDDATWEGLPHADPTYCNDDLGNEFDPGATLPAPLVAKNVGDLSCLQIPDYVGTGDCSNSIQRQFDAGEVAHDYTELRVTTTVPPTVTSLGFELAYLSTEYPYYHPSVFNDMFVAWLESEDWTGNISFDADFEPISLNAAFLELRDDDGDLPAFAGTCMRYHGGTGWIRTTAGVTAGDDIELVFAIFDMNDSRLDSYVLLDDFHWGCEDMPGPASTPVG